jgi:hypothetical protein
MPGEESYPQAHFPRALNVRWRRWLREVGQLPLAFEQQKEFPTKK